MANGITHTFVSAVADGGDATLVRPSNWNATHTITDLNMSGHLRVGSASDPTNTTAGDLTVERLIIADQAIGGTAGLVNILSNSSGAIGDPTVVLQGVNNKERLEIRSFGGGSPVLVGIAAGGTVASPTRTTNGLQLLTLNAGGYDNAGTPAKQANKGQMIFLSGSDWTTLSQETYLSVRLTPASSVTTAEYYRFKDTGMWAAGYLRIGALSAPNNTTAGDLTATRLNIGDTAFTSGVGAQFETNEIVKGYLKVGSTVAAPSNTTAGDITATRMFSGFYGGAGFAGTAFTPTVTSSSGTLGGYIATGNYCHFGNFLWFNVDITITSIGSASGGIICTLPAGLLAGDNQVIMGRESAVTGVAIVGQLSGGSNLFGLGTYNNGATAVAGYSFNMNGVVLVTT